MPNEETRCGNCGHEVQTTDKFCTGCGGVIESGLPPTQETDDGRSARGGTPPENNIIELFRARKTVDVAARQYTSNDCDLMLSRAESAAEAGDSAHAEGLLDAAVEGFPENQQPRIARGFFMFDRERWRESALDLECAIDLGGGEADGHVWVYFAESLVRLGRLKEALGHFDMVIDRINDYSAAYYYRGLCHFALGQDAAGLEDLGKAIQFDSTDKDPFVARAIYNLGHDEHELAHEDLLRAHAIDADDSEIVFHLGRAQAALREFDLAEQNFNRVIEAEPDLPGAQREFGALLIELGRFDDAKAALDIALLDDPSDVRALVERARLALEQGEIHHAKRNLNHAIKLEPDTGAAYLLLGTILSNGDNWREAEDAFAKAYKLGEDEESILQAKGWGLYNQNRPVEAARTFQDLIDLDPQNPDYQVGLGFALLAQTPSLKSTQLALDVFTEALDQAPEAASAYAGRAIAHYYLLDTENALKDSAKALALDPYIEGILGIRVLSFIECGEIDAARVALVKIWSVYGANDAMPDSEGLIARAALRLAEGQVDLAQADADEAVRIAPDEDFAHFIQGDCRMAAGNLAAAIESYDAAINIDPEYPKFLAARAIALRSLEKTVIALDAFVEARKQLINANIGAALKQQIDAEIEAIESELGPDPR